MRTTCYCLAAMIAMCIATGCGSNYPATGEPPRADREAVTSRSVRVTPAAQDTVARGTIVTGTLAAEDQVVLSFKIDGRVGEIAVDLGSRVR
jgi:multidrug efflux pump subunit AcrA (membrane-fusion protein)